MWMIQRVNIHKIVVEVIPEFHTHGGSHHHWRACVSPRKAFRRTAGDGAVVWWSPIWFDVFSHSNFPKIYFQREFAFKPVYSKKKKLNHHSSHYFTTFPRKIIHSSWCTAAPWTLCLEAHVSVPRTRCGGAWELRAGADAVGVSQQGGFYRCL